MKYEIHQEEYANREHVELATSIIKDEFKDKTDIGGKPYIEHLYRVAARFSDSGIICTALLHDLLEDCEGWSKEELLLHFPKNVVDAVVALTKAKGELYERYIERVCSNRLATLVKMSDLEDNMDIRRLDSIGERDAKRLNKYIYAWKMVKKAIEAYDACG